MRSRIEIPVENGIPLPKGYGGPGRRCVYPWGQMKVGNSFFISNEDVSEGGLRSAASYASSRSGWGRFYVGKVEGGFRVWRVE